MTGVQTCALPISIISCRKCKSCESGDYHLCKVDFQGMGMSINGGMAEQILVPEDCLISLDKRVSIINGWRRFECEGINNLLIGLLVQFVIFWKNNGILLPMFELSL